MPDTVIVTIRNMDKSCDMELPAKIPIAMWKESLEMAIRQAFPGTVTRKNELVLCRGGVPLDETRTLEHYGIYDGEYLEFAVR